MRLAWTAPLGLMLLLVGAAHCGESADDPPTCPPEGCATTTPSEGGNGGAGLAGGGDAGQSAAEGGAGGEGGSPPAPESYLDILAEALGFAQPTGGEAGPRVFVTNLDDSGPGTLREALDLPGPKWISFEEGLTGTIQVASNLDVPDDTTIDGRGADVTLSGYGLVVSGAHNVVITYLKFDASLDDEIRVIDGAGPVWIHRCTFRDYGDGAVDITRGVEGSATEVTVSYCHIDHGSKASLISATSDPAAGSADWNIYVTFHHNFFDGNSERSPRVRFAKVHHFNNYLREAGYIGASTLAELLVEHDIFETDIDRRATYVNCIGDDCLFNADWGLEAEEGGSLTGAGNWLDAGAAAASYATANEDAVFQEFSDQLPPYDYSLEPADDALRTAIVAEAGWRAVPLPP